MGGKTRRIYLLGLPLRVTLAPMSETLSYGERHRRRTGQEKTGGGKDRSSQYSSWASYVPDVILTKRDAVLGGGLFCCLGASCLAEETDTQLNFKGVSGLQRRRVTVLEGFYTGTLT